MGKGLTFVQYIFWAMRKFSNFVINCLLTLLYILLTKTNQQPTSSAPIYILYIPYPSLLVVYPFISLSQFIILMIFIFIGYYLLQTVFFFHHTIYLQIFIVFLFLFVSVYIYKFKFIHTQQKKNFIIWFFYIQRKREL